MIKKRRFLLIAFIFLSSFTLKPSAVFADPSGFTNPLVLNIVGHNPVLSAEEPFVSRNGRFLFFNSGETVGNKDLHFAEWHPILGYVYRGAFSDVNTPTDVQGNPTMDASNNFFYVDTGFPNTPQMAYFFDYQGWETLLFPKAIPGNLPIARNHGTFTTLIMGVEVNAAGSNLYFSYAAFANGETFPFGSDIHVSFRIVDGHTNPYFFDPNYSNFIMANINTPGELEYAAAISANELEFFFTRTNIQTGTAQIMRAARQLAGAPFGVPVAIDAISALGGLVEGPSLSPDGKALFFHRFEAGGYARIYVVTRP